MEGEGRYKYQNGEIYQGEFKSDKRNGKGKLFDSKKNATYEGKWVDD